MLKHFFNRYSTRRMAALTRLNSRLGVASLLLTGLLMRSSASAQQAFTWQQIKDKFAATNPTLKAAQLNIDESRAAEITAYLRPNPDFSLSADGFQIARNGGVWRPFSGVVETPGISYLHEREHKRELRRDQAKESTTIAESTYLDQERNLVFNLRNAFVQTLQAKAVLQNARENLDYWDRELEVNRTRFKAGDLAQVDLDRLELQRVQFESDYETASGESSDRQNPASDAAERPDADRAVRRRRPVRFQRRVKAARGIPEHCPGSAAGSEGGRAERGAGKGHSPARGCQRLDRSDLQPSGSRTILRLPIRSPTRPSAGASAFLCASSTGIRARRRGRRSTSAATSGCGTPTEAQVFNDVDSAYVTLVQNLNLLRPYKAKYLPLATDVRDKMSFSYRNGGASLLDYLDAEKSYRDTRLAYLNLIGSYLTAAAQMNMAAGREVIQ